VSFALVRNRNADFVGVEDPTTGAGKTDLVEPVPGSAARVRRMSVVELAEDTLSLGQIISHKAAIAITIFEV
jgi:hypothetical protein